MFITEKHDNSKLHGSDMFLQYVISGKYINEQNAYRNAIVIKYCLPRSLITIDNTSITVTKASSCRPLDQATIQLYTNTRVKTAAN